VVVADTGDIDAVARWKPADATTNPSPPARLGRGPALPAPARARDGPGGRRCRPVDGLAVRDSSARDPEARRRRVSTEVDARLSFDAEKSIEKARRLVALYERVGVGRERVLIKLASTWRDRAAERLEREGIHCNMTLAVLPSRRRRPAPDAA